MGVGEHALDLGCAGRLTREALGRGCLRLLEPTRERIHLHGQRPDPMVELCDRRGLRKRGERFPDLAESRVEARARLSEVALQGSELVLLGGDVRGGAVESLRDRVDARPERPKTLCELCNP